MKILFFTFAAGSAIETNNSFNNETYYYLKFLINDEEREFLVAKDKYDVFNEGMNGQLTLLLDKVFIDFTII